MPDGDSIDGFRVKVVDFETILLVGPEGGKTLALQQAAGARALPAAPPPPASVETETAKAGASMGLLAIERDACARAGHLPGVQVDLN